MPAARHRVSALRAVIAFATAVALHIVTAALFVKVDVSLSMAVAVMVSGLAIVPFAVMGQLDSAREAGAPLSSWLRVGAWCLPLVWFTDFAILVLLVKFGYIKFDLSF